MSIRRQISDICLYMGGGVEFNSAWGMSCLDREIAVAAINKKLKSENPNSKEYM